MLRSKKKRKERTWSSCRRRSGHRGCRLSQAGMLDEPADRSARNRNSSLLRSTTATTAAAPREPCGKETGAGERERPDLSLIRDRCLRFCVNSSRLVFVAAESSSLAVERERGCCVVVSFSVSSEEENARRREEKRRVVAEEGKKSPRYRARARVVRVVCSCNVR